MTAATASTLHGLPEAFGGGLHEVAPGTFAWLQPNGDWGESNAGLIVGDGAAALVDTAWDLPRTRTLLDDVRGATDHPLTHLLLTHTDGDHVFGAQLVPEAQMWCTAAAAAELAHEDPAGLHRSWLGARLLARAAVGAPRQFGRYVDWMLGPFDLRGIRVRQPDHTFTAQQEVEIGGRTAILSPLGPAHTAGDATVYLPDEQVLFAGDLLFVGVTPNGWAGDLAQWRRALDEIGQLAPRTIVPGHGPISGVDEIALLDRYWAWITDAATKLLAAGHSVDETAYRLVTSDEFAASPWGSWACPERTVCNVLVIDRARQGKPTAIGHRERPLVLWKVARLAQRLGWQPT